MHNRRLFWRLLIGGLLAVVLVIGFLLRGDGPFSSTSKAARPMREWPKIKVVSGVKYYETLESVLRRRNAGVVILPSEIVTTTDTPKPALQKSPVPPQVCGECHRDHWTESQQSAHFRTSSEVSRETLRGHFDPPLNRVSAFGQNAWFELTAKPDGFFQEFNIDDQGKRFHHEARIDLVIGSGKMGQSFASWVHDSLHQLPLSHFSESDRWLSSPGIDFPVGTVNFARPIIERCLDCHATWFQAKPQSFNRFVREGAMLGVTCSRCHGTGHEHVEHHRANPQDSAPHRIVNPANLDRDLANAVCAQCHSGEGQLVSGGFHYQPGEPLSDYLVLPKGEMPGASGDPHAANQLVRLQETKCYQNSEMTCFTCHDPHRNERGREELFVERCLKCHQREDCGQRQSTGEAIDRRCVECHMPLAQDAHLRRPGQGSMPTPKMRDHRIQVWPEATRSVLNRLINSRE